MIHRQDHCFLRTSQPPVRQTRKGADKHLTRVPVCIPAGMYPPVHEHPEQEISNQPARPRMNPVIWEARNELCRKGFFAIPVKGGSLTTIDLIAWDERTFYCIAVRRYRGDAGIRDITSRYDRLIKDLQGIRVPASVEIQLWISTPRSFQVYRVLAGGLMSMTMP